MGGLQERLGRLLDRWKARLPRKGRPAGAGPSPGPDRAGEAHPVLVVGGRVARRGRTLLSDLQFLVPRGRLAALVGEEGSGKTALLETLSGVRLPAGGRILLFGLDPAVSSREIRRRAAFLPSTLPRRPGWPLKRHLFHQGALCGLSREETEKRIRRLTLRFGLEGRLSLEIPSLPPLFRAFAGLTWALVRNPLLLCVDEPPLGWNRALRRAFWRELAGLRDQGLTLVAATRHPSEAWRFADEVMALEGGKLTFPGPDEMIQKGGLVSALEILLDKPPAILPPELAAFRPEIDGRTLRIRLSDPGSQLGDVVEAVLQAGFHIEDLGILDSDWVEEALRGESPHPARPAGKAGKGPGRPGGPQ